MYAKAVEFCVAKLNWAFPIPSLQISAAVVIIYKTIFFLGSV